jgi:hypothetical protein
MKVSRLAPREFVAGLSRQALRAGLRRPARKAAGHEITVAIFMRLRRLTGLVAGVMVTSLQIGHLAFLKPFSKKVES